MNLHLIGGWAYATSYLEPLQNELKQSATVTTHAFNVSMEALPKSKGNWWLAGWSLGGMRALEAVATKKVRPAGLILISSTCRFCREGAYEYGVEPVALRVMMHGLKPKRSRVLENFFQQSIHPDQATKEEIGARIVQAHSFSDETLLEGLKQLDELDMRSALEKIPIPVWIFHGKADQIIPAAAARYLASRIPKATLEILEGTGHEMAIHHAGALAEHIASALK